MWFLRLYQKVLNLSELVQSTEERPRVYSGQRNRDNTPTESVADYWKRAVAIPFLDVICSELECRLSKEKQAHWALCSHFYSNRYQVIWKKQLAELAKGLQGKWEHLLPISSAFESELLRWRSYCEQQALDNVSVRCLLSKHANNLFSPNFRELLKILSVLPIGSTEAEWSFSCVRTWLRSTMTTEKLSDLAVIAMHCHTVRIHRDQVCDKYMAMHPRRMMSASLLSQ